MTETVKQKKGQMDLTQGNVTKGFLVFMIPIILGNIFTQLYNMVDSIIVGQFVGGDALAAVGASFSLTMMINSFLISVGAGATVVVAQYYGAKKADSVNKTVNTAMIVALIVSVAITIIGLVTASPVMKLIKHRTIFFKMLWIITLLSLSEQSDTCIIRCAVRFYAVWAILYGRSVC